MVPEEDSNPEVARAPKLRLSAVASDSHMGSGHRE